MWQRWMAVHKVVLATLLPVLKRLPFKLSHRVLGLLGRLDLIVVPGQASRYRAAVADVAERLDWRWDVRATSQALGQQTYRWHARDLLLDRLSDWRAKDLFHVEGRDVLDSALADGKGVILLANHFGSHVLIAHWMFRNGYPLRWFGERPRNVSTYLKRQLQSEGPLGQSRLYVSRRTPMSEAAAMIVRLRRILEAGLVVKLACDVRWRVGKLAEAEFLGQKETFASVWVHLASLTGAAVIPVFCWLDEPGQYHLQFECAFHIAPESARHGHDARWVRSALAAIEEHVRNHPEQSNDYFFWRPTDRRMPAPHAVRARADRKPLPPSTVGPP